MLDDATGKWGIRVNRIDLKSIGPPDTIQQAMEMQMRGEREGRAAILNADGVKQPQILTAEGELQSVVLRAQALESRPSFEPKARRRRSERCFALSTTAGRTLNCCLIRTSRCSRALPRVRPTRCF